MLSRLEDFLGFACPDMPSPIDWNSVLKTCNLYPTHMNEYNQESHTSRSRTLALPDELRSETLAGPKKTRQPEVAGALRRSRHRLRRFERQRDETKAETPVELEVDSVKLDSMSGMTMTGIRPRLNHTAGGYRLDARHTLLLTP